MCPATLIGFSIMLGAARERFVDDEWIEIIRHDLIEPLPELDHFDAVVSSLAIHHLEHERKRSLYGEVFDLLDPSDRLLDVETQLRWLRELGFDDVDCYWKWLELALLIGVKPAEDGGAAARGH